jgi:hypothetical protein
MYTRTCTPERPGTWTGVYSRLNKGAADGNSIHGEIDAIFPDRGRHFLNVPSDPLSCSICPMARISIDVLRSSSTLDAWADADVGGTRRSSTELLDYDFEQGLLGWIAAIEASDIGIPTILATVRSPRRMYVKNELLFDWKLELCAF